MALEALVLPGEGVFPLAKPLAGFRAEILARLERFPYQENVFLMMKFRASNADLSDYIIEVLKSHGLRGVRADQPDWNVTDNVYNPIAVLYCCKWGIALFDEPEAGQAFSANVAYELGILHAQQKSCLILKHDALPTMPFDLIKDLYRSYGRDLQVRRILDEWASGIAANATHRPAGPARIVSLGDHTETAGAPVLASVDFTTLFSGARKTVDLLSAGPLVWFPTAFEGFSEFVRTRRGVVNVLLSDPEEDVVAAIQSVVGGRSRATVNIYRQNGLSGCSLFRFDDRMVVQPLVGTPAAAGGPAFLLDRRRDAELFSFYLRSLQETLEHRAVLRWTNRL